MPTTVTIELPGNAVAVLTYVPPEAPPASGAAWPPEADYPGIVLDIRLPRVPGEELIDPQLVDGSTVLLGENLVRGWGFAETTPRGGRPPWMCRAHTVRLPTLAESEAEARRIANECAGILRKVLDARARRLSQRASIVQLAHDQHATITHE